MITYTELEDGTLIDTNGDSFPMTTVLHGVEVDTQFKNKIDAEVEAGDAEIISFVKDLDSHKKSAKTKVNKRTDVLILAGVNHNSVDFKINIEKEITALGLQSMRLAGVDMQGKKFRGENTTYEFASTTDFDTWFALAFGRVEQVIIKGSELKDIIDAVDTGNVPADRVTIDAIVEADSTDDRTT
jgi:hypothetical protein